MKHGGRTEICLAIGALLSASAIVAKAAYAESPYSAIVERNVFNLHAPPPPVNPADLVKKAPPPKIILTGITTILGQKKTFLTIPPIKPGGPPESMMLAEGQAQYEIEVKRIDDKAQVVEVVNHGESQTLDFDQNGAKPPGAPPAAAGMPPQPIAMPAPPPTGVTPMPAQGTAIRPLRSLAPRSDLNNNNNNNLNSGFGTAGAVNNNPQSMQSTMTPEEQVALIELQRYQAIQRRDPISKIFPTTELTPEVTGQQAPQ